jgi:hypothetical protein
VEGTALQISQVPHAAPTRSLPPTDLWASMITATPDNPTTRNSLARRWPASPVWAWDWTHRGIRQACTRRGHFDASQCLPSNDRPASLQLRPRHLRVADHHRVPDPGRLYWLDRVTTTKLLGPIPHPSLPRPPNRQRLTLGATADVSQTDMFEPETDLPRSLSTVTQV